MIVNLKSGEVRVKWTYPHKHSKHRSSTHCLIYKYDKDTKTENIISLGKTRCHTKEACFLKSEGRYYSLQKALSNLADEDDKLQIWNTYVKECKR